MNSGAPALAAGEFSGATNMSDRLAALSILCSRFSETTQAEQALQEFENRHGHDSLTMDKWFATQAITPGPRTLERISGLTKHKAFSFANPNRMRSLIGVSELSRMHVTLCARHLLA